MQYGAPLQVEKRNDMSVVSSRVSAADAGFAAVRDFYFTSRYAERRFAPGVCDFTFGNPHEFPLAGLVNAIQERATPRNKDWFAYKTSELEPQAYLARTVGRELGLEFEPENAVRPRHSCPSTRQALTRCFVLRKCCRCVTSFRRSCGNNTRQRSGE